MVEVDPKACYAYMLCARHCLNRMNKVKKMDEMIC